MEYLNMVTETIAILIAFNGKNIDFWLNYDPKTFVGCFHNNSGINLRMLVGATAEYFTEQQAKLTLSKIADTMENTAGSRYTLEIRQWLADHMDIWEKIEANNMKKPIYNVDNNEAVKRPIKEIRYKMDAKGQHLVPDVLRYPHGAPSDIISDIIIEKVFS